MKPATAATPETGADIKALPTPDPLATLQASFDEQAQNLKNAEAEVEALQKKLSEAAEHHAQLKERLSELTRNSFLFEILNHDAGSLVDEVGEEFSALCQKVLSLDEKGSLNLKLTVKPHNATALVFEPEVSTKAPKPEPFKQILFLNPDGTLTRESHEQRNML